VRLVALKALLTARGEGISARAGTSLHHLQAVIQQMVRSDKTAVLRAIGAPDVQGPLLVLASGMRPPEPILLQVIPSLMAALSGQSRLVPEAILWEAPVDVVLHPAEGWRLRLSPPGKALLLDPTGLSIELHDGTRLDLPSQGEEDHASMSSDHPFTPLGPAPLGLHLSLQDSNPLSMEEAHPDKAGNAVSLGDRTAEEWAQRLTEALSLIELALPGWYREMSTSLSRLVPVGFEPELHLSASYREGPEVVYLTLHPDPVTMAEAIIHETQHSKCNLLCWMDPVLTNAYSTWTESPVRPDLRPLMGVLLAVHAFVPVAALHHGLAALDHPLSRTRRFSERRAEVLAGNAGGLKIVQAQGVPTASGARVIDALDALHEALAAQQASADWSAEALPPG